MKKYLSGLMLAATMTAIAADAPKTPAAASAKTVTPQAASAPVAAAASASGATEQTVMPQVPELAATAYIVRDLQSNQTLGAKETNTLIEPAALTKLMTAYLVFQALDSGQLKADQALNVSQNAWKAEGSRMFLSPDKPVVVADLLKGMIVQSANDATLTLAEALGEGSEAGFVKKMNDQAKRLGMLDTTFKNATGRAEDGHLSTVGDLAKLAGAIINDFPKYYPLFSMRSFTYNGIEQPNRNLLLYRDPSVDGMMSGHSPTAGYNLVSSSRRNDRRVVAVAVGMDSPESRAAESSKLLNWALQAFDTPKLYNAGQIVTQVKVYKGETAAVNAGFLDAVYLTIPHGEGKNLKPILETEQPVVAPIRKGQVLGKVKLTYEGKVLAEVKVAALNPVEEAGLWGRIRDNLILWWRKWFG
ncbi:D-alanyl-D-alanine carboxypeptidase family protein [Neisseria sp.]|uniref:D-alanyl-D-alanine carboxypeptidase family protein n=1 Tax=Neisseria sp. TaxID=192066 RepID=UPI00289FDF7F|nr:D-alanyl-D-alanine carboxypeptidase family protein [Neisseria sp.]